MFTQEQQESYIRLAMDEAKLASDNGHPPFGTVLVDESGAIILKAHSTSSDEDILAHAEINLIRTAARDLNLKNLEGLSLFTNAASCAMCASALVRTGLGNFYFGAPFEPHTNPAVSFEQLVPFAKQKLFIKGGILESECIEQIKQGRK